MSYFLYKCNHRIDGKTCGIRLALPELHTKYIKPPKCLSCGALLTYRDKWQEKKNKETTCYCDGMFGGWPHRIASSVWCMEHPTGPTDEDYKDRYGDRYGDNYDN